MFEEYVEVFIFICFELVGLVEGNDIIKYVMLLFDYIFWEFVVFYFGWEDLVYVVIDD